MKNWCIMTGMDIYYPNLQLLIYGTEQSRGDGLIYQKIIPFSLL